MVQEYTLDQRTKAAAFLTVIGQQLRDDPRYKTYIDRLGGYTDFASAYDEAVIIAGQHGHEDIARALKEYPKKADIGSNS